jgi:hypothetical protein
VRSRAQTRSRRPFQPIKQILVWLFASCNGEPIGLRVEASHKTTPLPAVATILPSGLTAAGCKWSPINDVMPRCAAHGFDDIVLNTCITSANVAEITAAAEQAKSWGVKAAPPRRVSPPEDRRGPGIPPGMPGQSSEMACPQPRLLAALSRATPCRRRAQPPAIARSGPKTASSRSCKQQLSFRPKAFRCRDLAAGRRSPKSCKQQLSSSASLDPGSTSAAQTPGFGILQTTTSG